MFLFYDEVAQSDKKLHPFIYLGERRKWSQKHELRQTLTGLMIEQMAHMVAEATKTITIVIGLDRLLEMYDWIFLGIFFWAPIRIIWTVGTPRWQYSG
jgi:hypothetical protein